MQIKAGFILGMLSITSEVDLKINLHFPAIKFALSCGVV